MNERQIRTASFAACLAILLTGSQASALTSVIGNDTMTAYFAPNNTAPHLEIDGPGSVENGGGVAVFTVGLGDPTFQLHIDFKDSSGVDVYDQLFLTAALDSAVDYTGVSIAVGRGGSTVTIDQADFVDAEAFGLPFPPDGITGIGNGAGEFLSLNGARVAGWDLMTSLERDQNDPIVLDLQIFGLSNEDQIVRFDTFGAVGGNIIGNNPNSGAAAAQPTPEPGAAVLYASGLLLAGSLHRRRRSV